MMRLNCRNVVTAKIGVRHCKSTRMWIMAFRVSLSYGVSLPQLYHESPVSSYPTHRHFGEGIGEKCRYEGFGRQYQEQSVKQGRQRLRRQHPVRLRDWMRGV